MSFGLPEKDYFSVDEICEQWNCDRSLMRNYIFDQKALRLAFKLADYTHGSKKMFLSGQIQSTIEEHVFVLNPAHKGGRYVLDPGSESLAAQKYLYIHSPGLRKIDSGSTYVALHEDEKRRTCAIEDAEGNLFKLTAYPVVGHSTTQSRLKEEEGITRLGSSANDIEEGQWAAEAITLYPLEQALDLFFITKAERDRFEEKYSIKISEVDVVEKESSSLDKSAPIPPMLPELDDQHPLYAGELGIAIAAWNYLYRDSNKPEGHSHSSAFDIWAKANTEDLGPTARKRIKAVCNPTANKNDGEFTEKRP